jgi:hypothetical protein
VVEIPVSAVLLSVIAMLVLQVSAIVGHRALHREHAQKADVDSAHQRAVTCYVVRITQGQTGPDVLTECGFIELPGLERKGER